MRTVIRDGSGGRPRGVRRAMGLALALCLVAGSGCVQNNDPETAAEPRAPTYVRVENQAFQDMTIYLFRSGQRIRLGQATGNAVTRLTIPGSYVNGATPLRFQADPIGGNRAPVSQEITVSPGDEVILQIPPS